MAGIYRRPHACVAHAILPAYQPGNEYWHGRVGEWVGWEASQGMGGWWVAPGRRPAGGAYGHFEGRERTVKREVGASGKCVTRLELEGGLQFNPLKSTQKETSPWFSPHPQPLSPSTGRGEPVFLRDCGFSN